MPLFILLPTSAWALCADMGPFLVPTDGSAGVGTDVRPIWVDGDARDAPSLTLREAESGAEVETEMVWETTSGTYAYGWIQPQAELKPKTAYRISDGEFEFGFETGDGPTQSALSAPTVLSTEAWAYPESLNNCKGTSTWIEDVTPSAGVTLSLDALDSGIYQANVLLDTGVEALVLGGADFVRANSFGCFWNLEEMQQAETVTMTVRSMDFAGQVSDWSEAVEISLPWPAECPAEEKRSGGCSTSGTLVSGWTGLLMAGSVRFVRRRSAASPLRRKGGGIIPTRLVLLLFQMGGGREPHRRQLVWGVCIKAVFLLWGREPSKK